MSVKFSNSLSERYASELLPPFYWLGITPVTELYLSFFDCDSDTGNHYIASGVECWSIFYSINAGIVILMLTLWLLIIITITFVSTYSHPYNKNPLSHFPWSFEVVYTVIRLSFNISMFIFDADSLFDEYLQWILCYLSSAYFLALLINVFPYYDPTVSWLFSGCVLTFAVSTFWHSLFSLTKPLLEFGESADVIFLLTTMIICLLLAKLLRGRRLRGLMSKIKVKSDQELDMQVYTFLMGFVLKESQTGISDRYLSGYLDSYKQSCRDDDCPLFSTEPFEIDRVFSDSSCEEKRRSIDKGVLRDFARYLLDNKSTKELFNPSLSLQLARIYAYVLGNLHLACVKILDTEDMDPGIFIQFALFSFKQDIINYFNTLEAANEKKGRGSFYKVLMQEKLLDEFVELLKNSTRLRTKFFTELKDIPNLNTLHKLGFKIMKHNAGINAIWKQLKAIYPFYRPMLKIYADYLCLVLGDAEEANVIGQILDKMYWEQDTAKELNKHRIFSEKSTSIIMGGERHNTGKILMASNSVEQLFGYAPKTLVNRSVMILIPEILRQRHNEILQKHFNTSKDIIKDSSFQSFGLNKNGYIFPIKIAKQQVYSLKLGILYVANISLDISNIGFNFILTDIEGKIAGVTKKIGGLLKITPNIVIEQQINIKDCTIGFEGKNLATLEGTHKFLFNALKEDALTARRSSIEYTMEQIREFNDVANFPKCQVSTLNYPQINFSMKLFQFLSIKTNTESEFLTEDKKIQARIGIEISTVRKEPKVIKTEDNTKEETSCLNNKVDNQSKAVSGVNEHEDINSNMTKDNMPNEKMYKIKRLSKTMMSVKAIEYSKSLKRNAKSNSLMNQPYSNFYPTYIQRLTLILYISILIMLILVVGRFVLATVLSRNFISYSKITLSNMREYYLTGAIAKTIQLLIIYTDNNNALDIASRDNYFDYSLLLGPESRKGITSYKDYIMQQIKDVLQTIYTDNMVFSKSLYDFNKNYAQRVNRHTLMGFYNSSLGEKFSYSSSLKYKRLALLTHTLKIIKTIEEGGVAVLGGLSEFYVLNTTYRTTPNYVSNFFNEMTEVYEDVESFRDKFRIGILTAFFAIEIFLIIVTFIHLTLISEELSNLLLAFTRISKSLLKEQLYMQSAFLRTTTTRSLEDLEDEVLNLKDFDEEESKKEETKKNRKAKIREHVPYRDNKWKTTFIITLIGVIIAGFFAGCDYAATRLSIVLKEKTYEIYRLKSNAYFNSYTIAYCYNYILSMKKGICGDRNCFDMLVKLSNNHNENLNQLLVSHKKARESLTKEYIDLSERVTEGNPCETVAYFKKIEQCTTFMGGLFRHGSHTGTKTFIKLAMSLYMDFARSDLTQELFVQYLNDKRLLDLEILAVLFLNPAYGMLAKELLADSESFRSRNIDLDIWLLVFFCLLLLVIAVLAKVLLLEHLRRVVYDAKILLSNLPSRMIIDTEEILYYFIDGKNE